MARKPKSAQKRKQTAKPSNPTALYAWRIALIEATHRRMEALLLSGEMAHEEKL